MDEFDLSTAVEILRKARQEAEEIQSAAWDYVAEVRDAERVTLYRFEAELEDSLNRLPLLRDNLC